jgi:DNA polymerase-3 subunit delta
MKLQTREIEKFLTAPPPACRVFIFYGPDSGLVSARGRALAQKFAPDLNDPFNVTLLDGDDLAKDAARLIAETQMMALGGGQRLIWLRNADDKNAGKAVENLLLAETIPAIVIIEAGELPPKSMLRKLAEAANNAAAIPCYVEDPAQVAQYVTRELAQVGWKITRDAATWFGQTLGGDRGLVQQEMEKLITYLGQANPAQNNVDVDTLKTIAAGGAVLEEDEFIDAIGTAAAIPMVQKLMAEGQAATNIIRTLGRHVSRLYATQLKISGGEDMKSAIDGLQPKLFFKRENAFRAQLTRFSLRYLSQLRTQLWRLEQQCKQTGAPDELLVSNLVLLLGAPKTQRQ